MTPNTARAGVVDLAAQADRPDAPAHATDDASTGVVLLALARSAIAARGSHVRPPDGSRPWLDEPGATFITLTAKGRLRGCIGSIQPVRSLRDDVVHNACAAAFHDPRFPPVAVPELPQLRIEVSLLSPSEPLPSHSREELLCAVRPRVDGLILGWHGHRGTFLPQVWEQLPDPQDFVEHLLHKAGLPVSFWSPDVTVRRFSVTAWHDPDELPQDPPPHLEVPAHGGPP